MKIAILIGLVFFGSFAALDISIATIGESNGSIVQNLPSRNRTPGYRNPLVKQSNLDTTVCVPGYSHSIRPPYGYTRYLKKAQIKYYGLAGTPASYEEDHFIPLSLGGNPYDTRNLWPEPRNLANKSDPIEIGLWHKLCSGSITLKEAQTMVISYKRTNG